MFWLAILRATSSPGPSPRRFFKMADRRKKRPGLLPTIRHFENRRRGGPGDEFDIAGNLGQSKGWFLT